MNSQSVQTTDETANRKSSLLYIARIILAALIFGAALELAKNATIFDLPVAKKINSYAGVPLLDEFFFFLDDFPTYSGAILTSLICALWVTDKSIQTRSRLLCGMSMAVIAGAVSRILQHITMTHPRPYYDVRMGYHLPSVFSSVPLNTWDSFPSDHATVIFALALIVCVERPRLGWLLAPWLILVETARIYLGAHYPSDLLGGFGLAALLVFAAQAPAVLSLGDRVAAFEKRSPVLFYFCGFMFIFELSTLFEDVRTTASAILHILFKNDLPPIFR